jgi:Nucleotidyltransferase of unknown function (DUF6036)
MREVVGAGRVREFMRRLGMAAPRPVSVFLTGGTSAVLEGWRETTVDIDLLLEPEDDDVLRELVRLKDILNVNVELASPGDFVPPPPGWRERSRFIAREGDITFYHYDFYGQALSKIERGHRKDLHDVREMISRGLIDAAGLRKQFAAIKESLFRYPALDAHMFETRLEAFLNEPPPG